MSRELLSSRIASRLGAALLSACFVAPAIASPIDGFGIGEGAQIDADSLLVAYDNNSDSLFITDLGGSATLTDGEGTPLSIDGTGLFVVLSIDGTGILFGGSLQLIGQVDELGFESGLLLTGEATEFGFVPTAEGETRSEESDELQLVFAITGGDAQGLWDGQIAVRLNNTGFLGSFENDWVNDGDGITVAGQVIPLPGALWFMLGGLVLLGRRAGTSRAS